MMMKLDGVGLSNAYACRGQVEHQKLNQAVLPLRYRHRQRLSPTLASIIIIFVGAIGSVLLSSKVVPYPVAPPYNIIHH